MIWKLRTEQSIPDETVWHKCDRAPFLARFKNPNPSGQIWRRKRNGKWEYQQDPETPEEYDARQY